MAIDNFDKVDAIGINKKTGNVILTISDHLDWSDPYTHLLALQNKINRYLSFIESGEIYESYPLAKGKKLVISVVKKYSLSPEGLNFMSETKKIVNGAGFGLESLYLENQ